MPAINYRYNPFQDVLNPVTITNEEHLIPASSPFTIQLREAPKKDAPSTISLKIDGVDAQEVAAYPAQGQFWPDYSTNADGNEFWNTGTILFNSADAGKIATATYKATGSIVWADMVNTYCFWSSGAIIAPQWARRVVISGCGGGGGGGGSGINSTAGSAGGVTSFGSMLSLGGGGGGSPVTGGYDISAGAGASGATFCGITPAESGAYIGIDWASESNPISKLYRGGAGGRGPFGRGGESRYTASDGDPAYGWGGGGGGGLFQPGNRGAGGGGAGGACIEVPFDVLGGDFFVITIGWGGAGGSGPRPGGRGDQGQLIVRWES